VSKNGDLLTTVPVNATSGDDRQKGDKAYYYHITATFKSYRQKGKHRGKPTSSLLAVWDNWLIKLFISCFFHA
jgi:hypothetical protein